LRRQSPRFAGVTCGRSAELFGCQVPEEAPLRFPAQDRRAMASIGSEIMFDDSARPHSPRATVSRGGRRAGWSKCHEPQKIHFGPRRESRRRQNSAARDPAHSRSRGVHLTGMHCAVGMFQRCHSRLRSRRSTVETVARRGKRSDGLKVAVRRDALTLPDPRILCRRQLSRSVR